MPEFNYDNFKADDFLQDDRFIKWMLKDDDDIITGWQYWLKQNPDRAEDIREAQQKFRLLNSFKKLTVSKKEEKMAWHQLASRIDYPVAKVIGLRSVYWLRGAAACLLFALSLLIYLHFNKGKQYTLSASNSIKSVVLEDGTHIILNKGATLERYSNINREVWVHGQAYFEVNKVKDNAKKPVPFLVHTRNFDIKVTGTVFQVSAETKTEGVILSEGHVALKVGKSEKAMVPGQYVKVNRGSFITTNVKPALYTAWKDKEYNFNNTSLDDLKILVENIYGLQVIVKDLPAFKNRELNGVVNIESRQDFLKTIGFLLDADVTITSNRLLIKPQRTY